MTLLHAPLNDAAVRSLKLGDTVFVSGPIVTGRDEAHIRALELSGKGRRPRRCSTDASCTTADRS